MAKATHTPGPWMVPDNKDAVLAATKTVIIAKCNAGPVRFQPASDTVYANARLISAAPELLNLLERSRKLLEENNVGNQLFRLEVDAAIAKVKGE